MSKVFVNIGLSLDGYMAPEGMTMGKPEYKNWGAKWGALMAWDPSTDPIAPTWMRTASPGPTATAATKHTRRMVMDSA